MKAPKMEAPEAEVLSYKKASQKRGIERLEMTLRLLQIEYALLEEEIFWEVSA